MEDRNKTWFFLILALFALWAFFAIKWYSCGTGFFCVEGEGIDRLEFSILAGKDNDGLERSEDRVPDDIEFRPVESGVESKRGTVRTKTTEVERIIECPTYLNGYMKVGTSNTVSEVQKLELFLNEFEGEDLDVNGVYQSDDASAVNRFQLKYKADVLDPIGLDTPTGNVFGLTRNHINALHCAYTIETSI